MLIVRLVGVHLFSKKLFTWLSLVMSLMASFCAVLFSYEMSWMKSRTLLSQFLRVFLPTLTYLNNVWAFESSNCLSFVFCLLMQQIKIFVVSVKM